MRVAGRIAIGTGVVIALLLLVLAWDLALVDQLAGVNQALSQVNLRAATITLQQARLLNQIDEFTRKYYVTQDSAYADRLRTMQAEFARRLTELRSLDLPPEVRQQAVALAGQWEVYWRTWSSYSQASVSAGPSELEEQERRLSQIDELRDRLSRVNEASQRVVVEQAMRSAEVSGRARRVSWGIAASASLLGLMILWLTIRSINRPLTQLTRGTRAVADGEFSVQLEARGGDELARLANSFNQMVRRLGEAERAKKDFLSHVSHELKTPLASMQETNELLLEEIPGPLNDKQKRFLALNLDSSRRLSAMISKLLDLSRMEARAMEYDLKRCDLVELARTVVEGFEARAREQGVRLVLQAPPLAVAVDCDHDRIIQVFQNLIDNALKFSPQGSAVELRVFPAGTGRASRVWREAVANGSSPRNEDMVLVEVADSGPGIPDDQKPRIFRRFHQISSADQETATGGVGLGLAICREITEAHKGWVGVRDNEGAGSVFVVALPAAKTLEHREGADDRVWREQSVGA